LRSSTGQRRFTTATARLCSSSRRRPPTSRFNACPRSTPASLAATPGGILGTTYEVVGLAKAPISFEGTGVTATMTAEGLGRATGDTFKNPVTGEPHQAQIVLPDGFIWKKGECGIGTFQVEAEGLRLDFTDTNWIFYEFDWSDGPSL
jgi:hypothetical protein